ncbi:MAG TPA: hypothetical protein VKQ36_13280 [Ktedonobacterales bacterium]|nr:hypothetical protein [Ktedonobacterales bacterium]
MTAGGYQQYSPYPASPYPYGYPPYPPTPAPQPQADAPVKQPGRPRLYALIAGVLFTILTVGAIALGAYAPALTQSESSLIPQGWSKVYDSTLLAGNDGRWDTSQGCDFGSSGLIADASSASNGTVCAFTPSLNQDLVSKGFLLEVTVGPAANVSSEQAPLIALGSSDGPSVFVFFDQQGNYTICQANCDTTSGTGVIARSATAAWHTNAYVSNTFALQFLPQGVNGDPTLVLFVNGEQATSIDISSVFSVSSAAATPFGVGALSGGAAIFTHATLYDGSVSSL